VTHSNDVGERANDTDGVGYRFAFAHATALSIRETEDVTTQFHHSRRETEAGTGTRLVEECSKFLAVARFGVHSFVIDDIQCAVDDYIYFGSG
jgi:hypothetical protein